MTLDELVSAAAVRVALLGLRREAEAEARHHAIRAIEAMFVGNIDLARWRVRLALGALAVWGEIPEPSKVPDLDEEALVDPTCLPSAEPMGCE